MRIGKIKARQVQAKEPVREIKRPNLGTIMAKNAVKRTNKVRTNSRLAYGIPFLASGLGSHSKQGVFSVISNTGIICMGRLPRSPKQ